MSTRRFFWKVLLVTASVVVVTALLVNWRVTSVAEARRLAVIEARTLDEALMYARLVAEPLARDVVGGDARAAALQTQARGLSAELAGRRFTLISRAGAVLADSHEDPALMDDHGQRPEVLSPGQAFTRESTTLGRRLLYAAQAVRSPGDGQALGFARVARSVEDIEAELGELNRATQVAAALALAVGLVLALFVSSRLTRPLQRIAEVLAAMGRGDSYGNLPVTSRDEIGQLATHVNDLSERLRDRMGRLAASVQQDRAILGAMEEGVLAVDAGGRIVLANGAAARLLGGSDDDPAGRLLAEVSRAPDLLAAVEACLQTGTKVTLGVKASSAAGERELQVNVVPLVDDAQDVEGCVTVLRDITELRRLETVRSDFVANVSHELKTPVAAIMGYVEAILDDPDMEPETRRSFLGHAAENSSRLSSIISDLLALARLESEDAVSREDVDLGQVVGRVVDSARVGAELEQVEIQWDATPSAPHVLGDARSLERAVSNLVENAMKYTPRGGHVRVGLRADESFAWIEVSDDGPGIPAHEQERIFERFYRVDKDRSRALGGTGLGLSIVKHAVSAHGGQITVESVVGDGATFRIRLPLPVGPDETDRSGGR